jgi:hypothetical protein
VEDDPLTVVAEARPEEVPIGTGELEVGDLRPPPALEILDDQVPDDDLMPGGVWPSRLVDELGAVR